jgi:hypothetical protein
VPSAVVFVQTANFIIYKIIIFMRVMTRIAFNKQSTRRCLSITDI